MKTPYQFLLLSSPLEQSKKFGELKAKHGTFYAWHGSSFGNWHCIVRIGLKNYSGTSLMSCGAAYGPGIYLSPSSATSFGYAKLANVRRSPL
jgi:poly [ADP-ribose] polymerase 6/8